LAQARRFNAISNKQTEKEITMNDLQNEDNQTEQLADLEPNSEVKGGGWTGNITLGSNATIGATQGRGLFALSTDAIGPQII
jgi:hypothetical protein